MLKNYRKPSAVIGQGSRSYPLTIGKRGRRERILNSLFPFDLESMRNVDIRTVDSASLADIRDIDIDPNLPFDEKAAEYLRQSKGSAYCFTCEDVIVKIIHSQTNTTMSDCMENFFQSL